MGSGKSVIADHLVFRHQFRLVKFAGPLKVMTRALLYELGYSHDQVEARVEGEAKEIDIPEMGVSARRVMQTLGTEWGRKALRENLWTDITVERCKILLSTGNSIIVDDLRYENELDALHRLGAQVYRVVRPGVTVTASHTSEGGLDHLRMAEIHNDGTIADLTAKVDALLHSL
ncbi:hypothetical protein CD928_05695 [Sphingopyxis sp. GW247-27LB]|nr:hypothetical protein CD928_05695 [Sphingopyxis sp. GW247-27LB]